MRTYTAMRIVCFLGVCSVMTPQIETQKKGLSLVKEWKQIDYNYPSDAARQKAIKSEEFIQSNSLPIDADVFYGPNGNTKIFVTVPRFVNGIPATLNTVSQKERDGNPLLDPYPSWEWNSNADKCSDKRLVSVFRTQIDDCGRLWVLDTGKIGSNQICHPQVVAFDPETNNVLHQYEIPRDQINSLSILVTPVVDVRDVKNGCRDTFIYVADVTGFGLIVIDIRRNKSWRITNKLFYPIPDYGTFTIAGESFDLMDGILGLAISPFRAGYDSDRILYFHALASNTENYVYTSVIRNDTIFGDDAEAAPREFHVYHGTRKSQSAAEAMDKNGVMYFTGVGESTLYCWNRYTDYNKRNFDVLDSNHNSLQFASGVKMVTNKKGAQELWVSTCRIQKVYTGTQLPNEINFRIQAATTESLLKNSKCLNRPPGGLNANYGGGNYGLFPARPQSTWGGVFSDISFPSGSRSASRAGSSTNKRDTSHEDKFIFGN